MFPKKICSLGILDININLILRKTQAEYFNFHINKYNSVEDLECLFFPKECKNVNNDLYYPKIGEINYLDYISLSSDNNLINTLLFINRAYQTKIFVEFIMLNQMEFSSSTKFVRKLIQEIFNRNYFFIIENKILDIPSKIKFIIKILNDEDDEIISMKSFDLFEINEMEIEQKLINTIDDKEDNIFFQKTYNPILSFEKINYNFIQTNYFLFDLSLIRDFKLKNNKEFPIFIYEIIKRYPKIKIILIIDESINNMEKKNLKLNKKLIDLSDIIFAFRNKLNNFYHFYNFSIKNRDNSQKFIGPNGSTFEENIGIIGNQKLIKCDLITEDKDKFRKNIPRLTIIFDNFNNVTIYTQQGIQMKIDYFEIFNIMYINSKNQNKIDYLHSNINKFYHIFIAGFLSRKIHEKSIRVCIGAGDLLTKKSLYLFMNNIDYINNIDEFNVLVPKDRKNIKRKKNEKIIKEFEDLTSKENKFILDCTNIEKCKVKEYNPLYDKNCASYLLKEKNMKHLRNFGFINKNGVILKDPDNINVRKKETKKNIIKNIIKNRLLIETNFFLRNNKIPSNKTFYTINTNFESNKNSPKFKSIFNSTLDRKFHNKGELLSPILRNKCILPQMAKTNYNLSNKLKKKPINLIKSNSVKSKTNIIIKNKKNLSCNNKNYDSNKYIFHILKPKKKNYNYFPKIIEKLFSKK